MPGKSAVRPSATGGPKKLYSQMKVAQSRPRSQTPLTTLPPTAARSSPPPAKASRTCLAQPGPGTQWSSVTATIVPVRRLESAKPHFRQGHVGRAGNQANMRTLRLDAFADRVLQPVRDDDLARRATVFGIKRGDRLQDAISVFGARLDPVRPTVSNRPEFVPLSIRVPTASPLAALANCHEGIQWR